MNPIDNSNLAIPAINEQPIQNNIHTIRGLQVILDRDLAELYGVETRALKQAVKRNIDRFPEDFMFELSDMEIEMMVSQSVIPSKKYLGGAKPFAFTEQGISSLSSVLTSARATQIHINIMRAFVTMRKFISSNADMFQRFERVEKRLSLQDEKIEQIFDALEDQSIKPKQHIFFDGQIFDAYLFVSDLIKTAKSSIILIDNYIDETTLVLFTKREANVKATLYTKTISKQLELDLQKYNTQYPPIAIKKFDLSHDRFLIIDEKAVYHFGASLKDLGKKWFAVSKMDIESFEILGKLK